jgi:hypothetical protein
MSEDREFEVLTNKELWLLMKALELEPKCMYCGIELKEGDSLTIFNKPSRVSCGSILCLAELMEKDEND